MQLNHISSAHAESLRARAISADGAQRLRLSTVSAAVAAENLFGPGTNFIVHGDCIAIPFLDFEGKPLIGADGTPVVHYRVSDGRDPKTLEAGKKLQRYLIRQSSGAQPYVPPGFVDLAGCSDFVVGTEGPLKAGSATLMGIPTFAIPGVTGWAAKAGQGPLTADTPVHPLILEAARMSKGVLILADSDAKENRQVKEAMKTLADAIVLQAGVPAFYWACPAGAGSTAKVHVKQGLDDWLAAEGQTSVTKRLEWMWSTSQKDQATLSAGGYVPLGYKDESNYVWSIPRGGMMALGAGTLTQPGTLMNLVGGMSWCELAYGKETKAGAKLVDWQKMGGEIIEGCIAAGPFNPDTCRRSGVWEADDGTGALVVNGADFIWRTDGQEQHRFGSAYVYPRGRKLGLEETTPQATPEEAMELLDALSTWKFARFGDPILYLGFLMHTWMSGAAPWRAHLSLTGPRGSGKSYLMRFGQRIIGLPCEYVDGESTTAGVRQRVKTDAIALFLDEGEADGKRLAELLAFLRSASSGAEVLRGTQDQSGTAFQLRVTGMVGGIVPPILNGADQSRFVRLELLPADDDALANAHRLVSDDAAAKELGLRLYARMVRSWGRLKAAIKTLRPFLGGDQRYADTISPVVAAAWVALFDGDMTDDEARDFVAGLDLHSERERVAEAKDEQDAFDHLLSKLLAVTVDGKRYDITGAEAIARSLEEVRNNRPRGDYSTSLGRLGLKVVEDGDHGSLLLSAKSPQLKSLYTGTRWEAGDLAAVLKRLPGADRKLVSSPVYIGGQTVRPLSIALPKLEAGTQRLPVAADLA